jgi:uncharacterized phosphosugar-binding protein
MNSFGCLFFETLIAGVESVRGMMSDLTEVAEAVASKLIDGGEIYIASVRPDFTSEGFIRSGGLMMLKEYHADQELSANDVVIVGWTDTEGDETGVLLREIKKTGAFVVGIGSGCGTLVNLVDVFLESKMGLEDSVTASFGGVAYPFLSLQNLILLWAFTGELVAALTRRGQMPAMFQSVLVPGARQRNADIGSSRFHKTHAVSPVLPALLGNAYIDKIKSCFVTVRDQEMEAISKVANACVDVRRNGGRIYAYLISHFPVHQAGAPGDPEFMIPLKVLRGETPDENALANTLQSGDLFFFLGYYRRPAKAYEIARELNCQIVEIITGTDASVLEGPEPDFVIHPGWHYTDSLVDVPGYDVRILPASGIMQAAIYWAVVGEMGELLKG